ncbi:MAG: hypothetical protein M3Q79_03395 [bacterium]|nr:hypothetical protein [bacterium]
MGRITLTDNELDQKIDSFLTRKFSQTNMERINRSVRHDRKVSPALAWKQYAL